MPLEAILQPLNMSAKVLVANEFEDRLHHGPEYADLNFGGGGRLIGWLVGRLKIQ